MCRGVKDLGRKTGTGHLFVGALLCPSWVGRGKGCWALWYLTATLALALSFFIRYLSLWVNRESQMINALPLGYFSRYRRFLRQHNNRSTSLLPLCVFKRKTFFFSSYLSQEKIYLFYSKSTITSTGKTPTFCCTMEFNSGRCYPEIKPSQKKIEISQKSCFGCT